MLYVHLALVVLQHETHCAWAFVNTEGLDHLAGAWRPDVVDRWMQHVTALLVKCPRAFADVLRPRVADVCAKARIGACPTGLYMRIC